MTTEEQQQKDTTANGEEEVSHALFEGIEKSYFDIKNLSNVSFLNTDISRLRFGEEIVWGEKKVGYDKFWGGKKIKEDRFKIIDERLLEEKINKEKEEEHKPAIENEPVGENKTKDEIQLQVGSEPESLLQEDEEKDSHTTKEFNLGSIKAVYRNLRENYEYRMRYDEASQFFIREMELKRKYREFLSKRSSKEEVDNNVECKEEPRPESEQEEDILVIKQNNWFRRNLFSLTAWYYHLSRYGESIWRPTLAGLVIVFLSTLFWLMQSNPTVEPSLPTSPSTTDCNPKVISYKENDSSKFIGLCAHGIANSTHLLKAFERSIADFLPLLPLGDIKVGAIDYVIKIIGGAVTFGLIAIALRRRFERRFRH